MDPIEPVKGSTASGSVPEPSQLAEASSSRQPLATSRPRAPSNRTRRPSIRLSRLPSLSSLDTAGAQQQQQVLSDNQPGPSLTRQVSVRSPVQEEDESWQGNRRRSNSEPRPGRWSSPPQNVAARMATPMGCLTEETSHQSPMPLSPQETADEQLQPPPPALARPASRNVLRRTSQAALNRFSRNRASTVSGTPTLEADNTRVKNEYGAHVVDVLDVIGKLPDRPGVAVANIVANKLDQTRRSPPCRPSPMCRIHCSSPIWAASSIACPPTKSPERRHPTKKRDYLQTRQSLWMKGKTRNGRD